MLQLQHSCYVSNREDDQEHTMNRIPFPAKSKANAAAQPEFEPYYRAEPAPVAKIAKPEPKLSALDLMYAYYDQTAA